MNSHPVTPETADKLARRTLFGFLLIFILSRICVLLIMSKQMPNFYFFLRGTHVHHLNYGIFLLSAVCGYSVFRRPVGRAAEFTAFMYGIALGLTFDEFGMWLHLGGSYWQRVSLDAIVVVAAVLAMISFAPNLKKFEAQHFKEFTVLALFILCFGIVLYVAGCQLGTMVGPTLETLEADSSP